MEEGRQRASLPAAGGRPLSFFSAPASQRAVLRVFAVALAALLAATTTAAQGCSLCYDGASQQSPQAASAMNTGILVLLLPALLLFAGVLATALRRRVPDETTDR